MKSLPNRDSTLRIEHRNIPCFKNFNALLMFIFRGIIADQIDGLWRKLIYQIVVGFIINPPYVIPVNGQDCDINGTERFQPINLLAIIFNIRGVIARNMQPAAAT